jgi:hypothetical protein
MVNTTKTTTARTTKRVVMIRSSPRRSHENGTAHTATDSSFSLLFWSGVVFLPCLAYWLNTFFMGMKYQLQQRELRDQFGLITIPNYLADDDELRIKLQNDTLWRACDQITSSGYFRFWYYPPQPPRNVFEEMVVRTYKGTPYWDQAISYEYWCNIMDDTHKSEWPYHTDRDEDVLEQERKLVFPLRGAVYYGYDAGPYDGGDFYIVDSVPYRIHPPNERPRHPTDDCGSEFCVTNPTLLAKTSTMDRRRQQRDPHGALRVPTAYNTLLYANVTHFHKVTPLYRGRRYALAMNANHWKPYNIRSAPTDDEMLTIVSEFTEARMRNPLHPEKQQQHHHQQ